MNEDFLNPPEPEYSEVNNTIWMMLEDAGVDLKLIEKICLMVHDIEIKADNCLACLRREENAYAKQLEEEEQFDRALRKYKEPYRFEEVND